MSTHVYPCVNSTVQHMPLPHIIKVDIIIILMTNETINNHENNIASNGLFSCLLNTPENYQTMLYNQSVFTYNSFISSPVTTQLPSQIHLPSPSVFPSAFPTFTPSLNSLPPSQVPMSVTSAPVAICPDM